MPQMSNLWWLPLMLYFSSIMFIMFTMLFSTTLINKNLKLYKMKTYYKNWLW